MPICLLVFLAYRFNTMVAGECLADYIHDKYLFHGSKSAYHFMRGLNGNENFARVSMSK